jgi:glycosyltransferase involved in cell wall biosynthesis
VRGVLQVIQQGQFRGAEVFALDLATELAAEGWRVSLLSLSAVEEAYAAAAAAAGLLVETAGAGRRPGRFAPGLAWALRSAIERANVRIVQANGASTLKYAVAARRLSRRPWRLVYRAIGMGSHWRRGLVRRITYRWLLAQADLVVAVSRAVSDDLVRADRVDPRRVVVVPNGVRPERIARADGERERTRLALGVRPGDHLLLYVGSLTAEKNTATLVDLAAALRGDGLPVHLLLVGAGSLGAQVTEEAVRRGLQGVVHLQSPRERLGPYYAAADLFVLPSSSEGMPAALIEAGMSGVPGVAYAVGGVPEIIEDGVSGRLIPPGDQQGLRRAAAELLRDDVRRRATGEAARVRCLRFHISTVGRAYGDAYTTLLRERSA